MDISQIIVLALIQGITEFLPISSSGHLLLPAQILGWPEQGLAFDIAVHVGTLIAVVVYFRRDLGQLTCAWCTSILVRQQTDNSRIAWFVILATIPAGLAGLCFSTYIEAHLRTTPVIAMTTIIFGLLLAWSDHNSIAKNKDLAQLTVNIVLIIGVAQALALIPGTSRSGVTITAALFCGLQRTDAARFSFLMSIPIILSSGALKTWQLLDVAHVNWSDIAWGAFLAAASAFICIHYFMRCINRIGMMPFVIYRLLLGSLLLFWSLS